MRRAVGCDDDQNSNVLSDAAWPGNAADFEYRCGYANYNRVTVIDAGRLGLVPHFTRTGDLCYIIISMPTPLVAGANRRGHSNLVGCCYIYGVMRGEMMEPDQKAQFTKKVIVLDYKIGAIADVVRSTRYEE